MSKNYFLLSILLICFVPIWGQNPQSFDIIFTRSGDEIPAIVLVVGDTDIQYKKITNIEGPTYIQKKADVFMIKYKNGEKDVFQLDDYKTEVNNVQEQLQNNGPKLVDVSISDDNSFFIEEYQKYYHPQKKFNRPSKLIKDAYGEWILGISSSSVLSNEILNVMFTTTSGYNTGMFAPIGEGGPNLYIINKTDKILYIDLANCFIGNDSFYKPSMNITTEGRSVGTSVNMGAVAGALGIGGAPGLLASGINIGGSASNGTATVVEAQRIISIAPHECEQITFRDQDYIDFLVYGYDDIKKGELKNYTEETSPFSTNFLISYSLDSSFQTYSQVSGSFFLKQVLGTGLLTSSQVWEDSDYYIIRHVTDMHY